MIEKTSFRFPAGTTDRIKSLAQPGESMTRVLLRALTAMENATQEDQAAALTLEGRVAALERALAALAPVARPEPPPGRLDWTYPAEVRQTALRMRSEGASHAAIQAAIQAATGRVPHIRNMGRLLSQWAEKAG